MVSLRRSSVKTGSIQRRIAWPLRNEGTHKSRTVFNGTNPAGAGQTQHPREANLKGVPVTPTTKLWGSGQTNYSASPRMPTQTTLLSLGCTSLAGLLPPPFFLSARFSLFYPTTIRPYKRGVTRPDQLLCKVSETQLAGAGQTQHPREVNKKERNPELYVRNGRAATWCTRGMGWGSCVSVLMSCFCSVCLSLVYVLLCVCVV